MKLVWMVVAAIAASAHSSQVINDAPETQKSLTPFLSLLLDGFFCRADY
jgi:hypothetical protein